MDDLISRAAVLSRFKALQEYDPEYEGRGWACNFLNDSREPSAEWYCIEDVVEDVPAVDAAPVVHGRWRDTGSGQECSVCNEIQYGYDSGRFYCANCGAKMDGKRRNDDATY